MVGVKENELKFLHKLIVREDYIKAQRECNLSDYEICHLAARLNNGVLSGKRINGFYKSRKRRPRCKKEW